jgi:hypothetical protein
MMALRASNVRDWIEAIPPDWTVYIDEGGLTLCARGPAGDFEPYLEIGGDPEPDEE